MITPFIGRDEGREEEDGEEIRGQESGGVGGVGVGLRAPCSANPGQF